MASDKSMYWLAAGVLALGMGTRYGHGPSGNEWVASAVDRTSEIVNRVAERASTQADHSVYVWNDRELEANHRAEAAMVQTQCRMAEVVARRAAAQARIEAAITRANTNLVRLRLGGE